MWPLAAQEAPTSEAPPAEATAPAAPPEVSAADDGPPEPPSPGTRRLRVLIPRANFSLQDGTYRFFGGVTMEADEMTIQAEEATYHAKDNQVLAKGNATIRTRDGNTYWGSDLEVDLREKVWKFHDFSVEYLPGFLGPAFKDSAFLRGKEVKGSPKFDALRGAQISATTCDMPVPHYYFAARDVEIYPNDKLIARDIDFYLLNRRVLHLPWFILWLRQRRSPIVPETGENEIEGRYVRLLYQYVLNESQLGGVRVDLTEKIGSALGLDHYYTVPNGKGEAFLYGRQGLDDFVVRVDHAQALPKEIKLNITGDIRRNTLFTYQPSTLTNINTRLQRATEHSNTSLAYIRRLSDGVYSTDNANANLRYEINTTGSRFSYSGEYSSVGQVYLAGDAPSDQELWNRVLWSRQLGKGTLNLRLDQHMDVDGDSYTGDSRFSGLQRLPEVYLETDQDRLDWDFLQAVPSQFSVGWGVFVEQPNNVRLNRYLFNWKPKPRPITLGRTVISPYGNLRQTFYGDPDVTAMYAINGGLSARTILGGVSNTLNYANNQYHGYSPFRFDATYPSESITDSIQYLTNSTKIYLNTGRDLRNERWQDLSCRAEVQVTPFVSTTQSIGYDLNNKQWRDLVSQYQIARDPVFFLKIGSRYDMRQQQMRQVSSELAWVINPVWKVQWLGAYDATTKEIRYNEFLVTRDLHCWDTSVMYSYQQQYVYLYFRLKALDLPLPQFGIGRGGQILATTPGWPQ